MKEENVYMCQEWDEMLQRHRTYYLTEKGYLDAVWSGRKIKKIREVGV